MDKPALDAILKSALAHENQDIRDDITESIHLWYACTDHKRWQGDWHDVVCTMLKQGRLEGVRYLIEECYPVDAKNENLQTLLMVVSSEGNLPAMRLLVELGADLNASCDEDQVAAIYAVNGGHLECLKYLREQGANISHTDGCGFGLLHLVNTRDDNQGYLSHSDSLYQALQTLQGRILACVTYLVEQGLDIEAQDNLGCLTPMTRAIRYGCPRLASHYLDLGADIERSDNFGNTPLSIAASDGCLHMVQKLLQAGAEIDALNMYGDSALFLACLTDQAPCVVALLEAGADPIFNSDQMAKFSKEAGPDNQCLSIIAAHQARMAARQSILEVSNLHPRPA